MKGVVFTTVAQARNFRDFVDSHFGLPADGVPCGGRAVAPVDSRTLHQFVYRINASQTLLAVIVPDAWVNNDKLVASLTARGLAIVDLDATWLGAQNGTD